MIFKIFSPKKLAKILTFFAQTTAFFKNLIITLVFEKNANFCRKLAKIAENCDHNIDPRVARYFGTTHQRPENTPNAHKYT
jgi:hypothetical protein